MSTEKPTHAEEEYFAREEVEKRYKLAKELEARRQASEAAALKAAHHMKCPKCGNDLQTVKHRGVEIEKCFHCGATVLDAGELEKLAGPDERSVLGDLTRLFRR